SSDVCSSDLEGPRVLRTERAAAAPGDVVLGVEPHNGRAGDRGHEAPRPSPHRQHAGGNDGREHQGADGQVRSVDLACGADLPARHPGPRPRDRRRAQRPHRSEAQAAPDRDGWGSVVASGQRDEVTVAPDSLHLQSSLRSATSPSGRFWAGRADTVHLSKLTVRGLRSSADHEIEVSLPGRFAVLVGANGSGKTTICDAAYLGHTAVFPRLPRMNAAGLGSGTRSVDLEYSF